MYISMQAAARNEQKTYSSPDLPALPALKSTTGPPWDFFFLKTGRVGLEP
jgi:hypothetical protein